MHNFKEQVTNKRNNQSGLKGIFRNEGGAIDLASIMVGIIVIGLIGGVIAATVFAVIPWTQDNAAKHQLDSIVAAESAYMGLASDSPPALPAGHKANSFADSEFLASANLLQEGSTYCAVTTDAGKGYQGFSQSASGRIWSVTDKNTKPSILTTALPSDCSFITNSSGGENTVPTEYVDPTPTKTILTYQCDITTTGTLPMKTSVTGTESWTGGITSRTYTNAAAPSSVTLNAGVEYTMTFDGTYKSMTANTPASNTSLSKCLRSVDHWGTDSGVTNASYAFYNADKLVSVPDHIPSTLTNVSYMFQNASSLNDAVNTWDTSEVTNMAGVFAGAKAFNQPVDKWNTSKVTNMTSLFAMATSFNQPLNSWDVSSVSTINSMFDGASSFDQPLNEWRPSTAVNMQRMFFDAVAFNQPLDAWTVSKVSTMSQMFSGMTPSEMTFHQDLSGWQTDALTNGANFAPSTFPTEYLPPKTTKQA